MRHIRLDRYLIEHALVESRSRAASMIMAGKVLVNDKPATKAGDRVPDGARVRLKEPDHPWVSRGGVKLDHAIKHFAVSVQGKTCLDVGASTGGFTEVLLHHGAARVYAVDVGTNQLAWKLRRDPRVVVLEKTNARHLTETLIPNAPHCIVCDASFISLEKVLPAALRLGSGGTELIILIKPQFQAERHEIEKGGIVRDNAVHTRVCAQAGNWLETQGWTVTSIIPSPIHGQDGNREFLCHARMGRHQSRTGDTTSCVL